ncbi:MAG TPA: hypothetical protein VGS22_06290 [Thermoanaerobaculia bacterium]|jgi:hypothetical protein|nr:hypothetical protein [Thermoanaerobaculia bacterium]
MTDPSIPSGGETPPRRTPLRLVLAGALWVLPLWLVRFLPMVDYPQQLAAASILRFYGDPARALRQTYEIVLLRPQGLFEMLTAGLGYLVPIEAAGKLVLSLSLLAVPLAAALLCRRTGRPEWYALLALAPTYNDAFAWGFVDNLLAYPLVLLGVALADRFFDRPFGGKSWTILAALGLSFYTVHLEFLLVFAGAVGWLALVRRPSFPRLALWLSSLIPGLALGAGVLAWAHLHASEVMTGYQQRLAAEPSHFAPFTARVAHIPSILFSGAADGACYLLTAILLVVLLVLSVPRSEPESGSDSDGGALYRTRFLSLGAWIALLYFVLPNYTRGYLVSDRLLPLAVMVAIAGLPCPPEASRRWRLAALLVAGLLAGQWMRTAAGFLGFASETEGLGELLDQTEPGQSLAGLIYEPGGEHGSHGWDEPPVLIHTPAYYQVAKGGRIHFSFAQFFNSPVAYRPGRNEDDPLLAEWDEWNPQKFDYGRHGLHYRYFLVRGGAERLMAAFGPHLAEMQVKRAGRWFLVERPLR